MKASRLTMLVVMIVALALPGVAHAATNPAEDKQSVVGYAYTDECVTPGQELEVVYVLTNQSATKRTVIVWHYGVGPGEGSMKGPMFDIDTFRSGLHPSSNPSTWYWRVTLKPGETAKKSIFIRNIPGPYGNPEPWDPAWGPKPMDRFYSGATVNVKNTSLVFYPNVQPAYCG